MDLTWAKLGKSEATVDAPNWPFQNTGYVGERYRD